jgi:hypothetical protein
MVRNIRRFNGDRLRYHRLTSDPGRSGQVSGKGPTRKSRQDWPRVVELSPECMGVSSTKSLKLSSPGSQGSSVTRVWNVCHSPYIAGSKQNTQRVSHGWVGRCTVVSSLMNVRASGLCSNFKAKYKGGETMDGLGDESTAAYSVTLLPIS